MARDCRRLMGLAHTYVPVKRLRWPGDGGLWFRIERYWACVKCTRTHTWDDGMHPEDG